MKNWISRPAEVEAKVLEWQKRFPELLDVETITQYVGTKVYGLAITDKKAPRAGKKVLLATQPHAHEPATTAAMMSVTCQLLEGRLLDGTPTKLDRERILRQVVFNCVPLGNPDGSSRAPVEYWDGSYCNNEEFWCWMRGKDRKTGKMWKRLGRWSTRVETDHPERIGIVYEQLNEHEYAEPNRCLDSSFFRMALRLNEKHGCDQWLDLHQTEFEKSQYNCMIILPLVQKELPPHIQAYNLKWGEEVVEAMRREGGNPIPKVEPLNYTGEQAAYFRDLWGPLEDRIPVITSEIQNNNPRTSPDMQRRLEEACLRVSLERLLH
jgi:hypothetical protein